MANASARLEDLPIFTPLLTLRVVARVEAMTPFIVPAGEITFQNLCDANPNTPPLNVLRFITKELSEGRLRKNRAGEANRMHATYTPIDNVRALAAPCSIDA
jgi:hypothetical protein